MPSKSKHYFATDHSPAILCSSANNPIAAREESEVRSRTTIGLLTGELQVVREQPSDSSRAISPTGTMQIRRLYDSSGLTFVFIII